MDRRNKRDKTLLIIDGYYMFKSMKTYSGGLAIQTKQDIQALINLLLKKTNTDRFDHVTWKTAYFKQKDPAPIEGLTFKTNWESFST